ncbi:alpha/beta fold hydrolase [Nonomuraea gerenzanensis]|uniref:Beta-ketoadipate enol-lactone hydrolase n=1 Tax=Nonomuraea gerenzanensis TaxID=93944 RepID=A0A1M4EB41_9ACTN|nr:alpha/beta hydrolase [Nonomuraea gerenzanensis]UBU18199.1 alpha/beta hydrolase [Nonomuraea gerenzanensis]SBO96014.1 Beta-ketoadipate enol-lactone hydrolase [Nonomuraea gerenzanensis]
MTASDLVVGDRPVPLAVRDHGGDGAPILLLHGLGGTLLHWDAVAPLLTGSHRVVAMDLRGHGLSGDGPWEWEAVLDDVRAVADHLGLDQPFVVGHSLGGMVAVRWALRHPDAPGIVNLDGLRSAETEPRHYAGLAQEELQELLAEVKAVFDAQAAAMAQPLPEAHAAMYPQRSLLTTGEGVFVRPSAALAAQVRYDPYFLDSVEPVAEIRCPALFVLAGRNLPGLPGRVGELMTAQRAGIRRDLLSLLADRPHLRLLDLDASHAMVVERPEEVARAILDFHAETTGRTGPAGRDESTGRPWIPSA